SEVAIEESLAILSAWFFARQLEDCEHASLCRIPVGGDGRGTLGLCRVRRQWQGNAGTKGLGTRCHRNSHRASAVYITGADRGPGRGGRDHPGELQDRVCRQEAGWAAHGRLREI